MQDCSTAPIFQVRLIASFILQMRKSWYMSAFYAPLMAEWLLPADDLKVRLPSMCILPNPSMPVSVTASHARWAS
jgi:hypothetical protein